MSLHNPLFFAGVTPEQAEAAFPEIYEGKEKIVAAIVDRGGDADISDSYDTLAESISNLVTPSISLTPLISDIYPTSFHDMFAVMADHYDEAKPYMYILLLKRYTPSSILSLFVDGSSHIFGGETDAGKVTRWVIFKSATQAGFSAVYNVTYAAYILGVSVFNADIKGCNFNGSLPRCLFFNDGYNVANLQFPLSQFASCPIYTLVIPDTPVLTMSSNTIFSGCSIINLKINKIGVFTISGNSVFYNNPNLVNIYFCEGITDILITGASTFQLNASLISVVLPSTLLNINLSGVNTFYQANFQFLSFHEGLQIIYFAANTLPSSIVNFIVPDSIAQLTLGSAVFSASPNLVYVYFANPSVLFSINNNIFTGCTSLAKIELGLNWNYAIDIRSAIVLTRANIVDFIFTRLKDNVGLTAKTITLSSRYNTTGADPLTAEQKMVATSKNWTLAYA